MLAGGESAVLVMVEAVTRLLPGVVGNAESVEFDSHADGLLEGPSYTRPAVWEGHAVPPVLLSGDHAAIARWRRAESLRRTADRRPDLLAGVRADRGRPRRAGRRRVSWVRPTARVLVLSPEGRVLLLGARLTGRTRSPATVQFWYTPGGGVEDGESLRAPRPGSSPRRWAWSWRPRTWRARCGCAGTWAGSATRRSTAGRPSSSSAGVDHVVDPAAAPSSRCSGDEPHRWWSAAEVAACGEAFAPRDLADLLPGPARRPVDRPTAGGRGLRSQAPRARGPAGVAR